MTSGRLGARGTLSVLALASGSHAAPVASPQPDAPTLEDVTNGAARITPPYAVEPAPLPYFSHGRSRPFVSGRAVAGLGFGRLALNGGYGKPHWIWAGPEAIGLISPYYSSMQAGIHLSAVLVEAMLTLRRTYSFTHGLMLATPSATSDDLHRAGAAKLHYSAIDASLWGLLPYGRWLVTWEVTYVRPLTVDGDSLLYEEVQRAVISRRGLWTTKLGPMLKPWAKRDFFGGLLLEHLTLLGRSRSLVVRVGPSIWANLGDHWDAFAYLSWPVAGPDQLGFWDGMYGSVGVMYRFSTGEAARPAP